MFKPRCRGKRISVYDAMAGKSTCLKKRTSNMKDKNVKQNLEEKDKNYQKTEDPKCCTGTSESNSEIDHEFLYRMLTMDDDSNL